MNVDSVLKSLNTIGHFGHTITVEEGMILHSSLLILQNENHFKRVYFWGRIFGAEKDYYIAYGYRTDALSGKIYYYSTNCINWGLLPLPTENGKVLAPLCTTKFQGDPSLVLDVLLEKDDTFLGKLLKEPHVRKLKEEDRLSATIYLIEQEAMVVPRGAIFRRPDGVVVENQGFQGLNLLDAREIKSYQHYRDPTQKRNSNLLTRDDYNYAIDFLDPIDIDIPEGCWILQLVEGDSLVILKALYWPGMIFYHYVNTPHYGFVYFGNGKRCLDMPFLLMPQTI